MPPDIRQPRKETVKKFYRRRMLIKSRTSILYRILAVYKSRFYSCALRFVEPRVVYSSWSTLIVVWTRSDKIFFRRGAPHESQPAQADAAARSSSEPAESWRRRRRRTDPSAGERSSRHTAARRTTRDGETLARTMANFRDLKMNFLKEKKNEVALQVI